MSVTKRSWSLRHAHGDEVFSKFFSCSKYAETVYPSLSAESHIMNGISQPSMSAVVKDRCKHFYMSANEKSKTNLKSNLEVILTVVSKDRTTSARYRKLLQRNQPHLSRRGRASKKLTSKVYRLPPHSQRCQNPILSPYRMQLYR